MQSRELVAKSLRAAAALSLLLCAGGCYHYTFQHRPPGASEDGQEFFVTYVERRPTFLNGFIGNGSVDTTRYCERPVRTELRVTAADVALSVGTLLIYTPHTLYVTCDVRPPDETTASSRPGYSL